MKIQKEEIENSNIGEFDNIESTISKANMGIAFTMVSKSLYSDPIGSFIRELVSNAVDANVDANKSSPVLVHIYEEDGVDYIEVKDNGVGMSPHFFRTRYMSWFDSDKRDTNTKIGGWGLGSKSPLAYQPIYEIITRFEGKEYHYSVENLDNNPTASQLSIEDTTECNGTTVRVEIKDGDTYKISRACVKQLVYFDNVYVKNELTYFDNNFKIYESTHYKLRNKDYPYGNYMHICLGQVCYPIDWDVLNIEPVRLPVALTFNVGDLAVTLSREEINYTETVKQRLVEKIELVKAELNALYQKQLSITDLFDFIKALKKSDRPPLRIKDIDIDMSDSRGTITFAPFEGVNINANSIADIFSIYNVTVLKKGKQYKQGFDSHKFYYHLYRNTRLCYICETDYNYYNSLYLENGYIFKQAKLTRQRYLKLANVLNRVVHLSSNKKLIKEGTSKLVYQLNEYVKQYIKTTLTSYDNAAPEDFIREIKKKKQ